MFSCLHNIKRSPFAVLHLPVPSSLSVRPDCSSAVSERPRSRALVSSSAAFAYLPIGGQVRCTGHHIDFSVRHTFAGWLARCIPTLQTAFSKRFLFFFFDILSEVLLVLLRCVACYLHSAHFLRSPVPIALSAGLCRADITK